MNKYIIIALSIVVPSLVAVLFFATDTKSAADWVYGLPKVNAMLNGSTAIFLILAVVFIKKGNEAAHKRLILTAFVFGVLFLLSYVTYHASVPSTKFGDIKLN